MTDLKHGTDTCYCYYGCRCGRCREAHASARRTHVANRSSAGTCVDCPEAAQVGKKRCLNCSMKNSTRTQRTYWARRTALKCVSCGKDVGGEHARCTSCRKRYGKVT